MILKVPAITYGTIFQRYFTRVWNSKIRYINEDLVLIDDDVKGAIIHTKYHPYIVLVFSFQIVVLVYVPIGGTFGSNSSPFKFEPLARPWVWLTKHIFRDNRLVKSIRILSKV